jgi:hypothetical protein
MMQIRRTAMSHFTHAGVSDDGDSDDGDGNGNDGADGDGVSGAPDG